MKFSSHPVQRVARKSARLSAFTPAALATIATVGAFAGTALAAEDDRPYTFGTTVVSTSWFQGRIYYLKENTSRLPQFENIQPVGTIYASRLNIWPQEFDEGFPGITERFEWFAIDYSGRFWAEAPGTFRFSLLSDDGARLYIDDQELIDNDGTHSPSAVSARATLSRGVHSIRVSYFQGPRFTVALVLAVAGPGAGWRIFDMDDFPPPKDPAEWVQGSISDVQPYVDPAFRQPGRKSAKRRK